MYEKVQALRKRLEDESGQIVSALALEKMAYVLGKEAQLGPELYAAQKERDDGPVQSCRKRKDAATGDEKAEEEPEQPPATKKRKKSSRS